MAKDDWNNPLHGIGLKELLMILVDQYGWEVLAEHININCFKTNPSIESSFKFLKKTEWAREKLEAFYLYKHKKMPKPNDAEYELPPRQRTFLSRSNDKKHPSENHKSEKDSIQLATKTQKETPSHLNQSFDPWKKWRD